MNIHMAHVDSLRLVVWHCFCVTSIAALRSADSGCRCCFGTGFAAVFALTFAVALAFCGRGCCCVQTAVAGTGCVACSSRVLFVCTEKEVRHGTVR